MHRKKNATTTICLQSRTTTHLQCQIHSSRPTPKTPARLTKANGIWFLPNFLYTFRKVLHFDKFSEHLIIIATTTSPTTSRLLAAKRSIKWVHPQRLLYLGQRNHSWVQQYITPMRKWLLVVLSLLTTSITCIHSNNRISSSSSIISSSINNSSYDTMPCELPLHLLLKLDKLYQLHHCFYQPSRHIHRHIRTTTWILALPSTKVVLSHRQLKRVRTLQQTILSYTFLKKNL